MVSQKCHLAWNKLVYLLFLIPLDIFTLPLFKFLHFLECRNFPSALEIKILKTKVNFLILQSKIHNHTKVLLNLLFNLDLQESPQLSIFKSSPIYNFEFYLHQPKVINDETLTNLEPEFKRLKTKLIWLNICYSFLKRSTLVDK